MAAETEPRLEDFTCSTCKAPVGEPCRSDLPGKRTNGHARRQDKLIRALQDWRARS